MKKSWMFFFFVLLHSSFSVATDIKMMTWNVYMLPKPLKFSEQKERTRLIVEHLKKVDHDVIVLQEAFTCPFRNALSKHLSSKYPYQKTLGKSGWWKQVMNSGVTILSRYPFTVLGKDFYQECGRADCYASKGVILVRLDLPEKPIQLAVTHLQSGDEPEIVAVRRTQLAQIKKLLDAHQQAGVPQLLMGDLNIDALKVFEFSAALSFLGMENSDLKGDVQSTKAKLTKCMGKENTQKVEWIDHVLVRHQQSGIQIKDKKVRIIQDFVKKQWCDLSDHYPVEATIELSSSVT